MIRKLLKTCGIGALFIMLFLACRADNEVISYSKNENANYVSKSLWKEDEVFIRNVMKIYEENEIELKRETGTPLWNYAITSGYFDESYLKVPVSKDNKVVGILQVRRQKDINKVYFYFNDNQNDIDFFQTLIFDRRHKKPLENIIELRENQNGKMDEVTCITTSFEVGCASTQINCTPLVEQTTTCTFTSGGDGGDGGYNGNGGSYDYPHHYGGGGNPNGTQNPCAKAQAPSSTATLNSKAIAYTNAQVAIVGMNNGLENGVVLGNVNGTIQATGVQTGGISSIGNLASSFSNPIGDIHNHPNNNPPSPGDVYSLINIRNQYSNYNTRYVITQDGTTYALVVTDVDAMNQFLQNYPPYQSQAGMSPNFPGQLFDVWYDFTLDGLGNKEMALSYVLDKYKAGVALTKMDLSGSFKKTNVNQTNLNGTITYTQSNCP